MEFAHLIKSPRVEKVVVHRSLHKSVEGVLCITGHHLIFSAGGENPDEFWVNSYLINFFYILMHLFFKDDSQNHRFSGKKTQHTSSCRRHSYTQVQRFFYYQL
jgi:hypothetical protein